MDTNQSSINQTKVDEIEERIIARLAKSREQGHERSLRLRELEESMNDTEGKMRSTIAEIKQDIAALDQADAEADQAFEELLSSVDDSEDESQV